MVPRQAVLDTPGVTALLLSLRVVGIKARNYGFAVGRIVINWTVLAAITIFIQGGIQCHHQLSSEACIISH